MDLPRRARAWRIVTILLVAALAAVMLATVFDYGMTGDEGVQHRYARRVLRWYATLGADRSAVADEDISMYGGFFEVVAESAALLTPDDPYRARHVINVLFGLAAVVAEESMGRRLAGRPGGALAAGVLALTPPFYGHAFNNPKDIPFAATFAVAAAVILAVSDRSPRLRPRDVIASGVAIGLTAGVRVAGLALFAFAIALWVAVAFVKTRGRDVPEGRRAPRRPGGDASGGPGWPSWSWDGS
jgi:4-amino-4-deoxy-L-arabinose transferase-like glycosyltransferase